MQKAFPWPYWVSALVAVLILIPSGALMIFGMVHAGEEAARPKKEHGMYSGIYEKVRHPQSTGEVFLWWVIAFFLNSPFLALFSFIYVPIFLLLCWAEEFDLVKRFGDEYVTYYQRTGAFWPKR
jgi:protein-S-isoprenylcysteine O-methyltransferase Ste14